MLVHMGLAPAPPGWDPNRYDNVARLNSGAAAQGFAPMPQGKGPPYGGRAAQAGGARWQRDAQYSQEAQPLNGNARASRAPGRAQPPEQAGTAKPAPRGFSRGFSNLLGGGRAEPQQPAYDKASEIVFGFEYDDERQNGVPYEDQLRADLATTYYWSGHFMQDYMFFVANWHPLFGVLCSHPLHPWSKSDRLGSFLVSSSLTLLPSVWMSQASESLCEQFGDHTGKCGWVTGHLLIMAFITTPVMFVEVALYLFAMYTNVYCRDCGLCVCCKRSFFFLSLCFSAFVLLISYGALQGQGMSEELLHPFLVSRVQSWVVWFPLWFFMPCVGFFHCWNMERRALARVGPG